MITLGIDPGMALMGYGVVESKGDSLYAIASGVISTTPDMTTASRLSAIYHNLNEIIDKFQPTEVAIEFFVAKNLRTALMVGQARGVAILAAANKGLPVYDYSPLRVKQQVCSYGRGSKKQVEHMVKLLLGLTEVPKYDDTSDALAVAICHIQESNFARLIAKQTGASS